MGSEIKHTRATSPAKDKPRKPNRDIGKPNRTSGGLEVLGKDRQLELHEIGPCLVVRDTRIEDLKKQKL